MGESIAPRLLLDTHVLTWWMLDPKRLSRTHRALLNKAERTGEPVAISAITLREMAAMIARGRLEAHVSLDELLEQIESHPLIEVLPVTAAIAAESVRLGEGFPRDPADQLIVATARCHGLSLMTADQRILEWGQVTLA